MRCFNEINLSFLLTNYLKSFSLYNLFSFAVKHFFCKLIKSDLLISQKLTLSSPIQTSPWIDPGYLEHLSFHPQLWIFSLNEVYMSTCIIYFHVIFGCFYLINKTCTILEHCHAVLFWKWMNVVSFNTTPSAF